MLRIFKNTQSEIRVPDNRVSTLSKLERKLSTSAFPMEQTTYQTCVKKREEKYWKYLSLWWHVSTFRQSTRDIKYGCCWKYNLSAPLQQPTSHSLSNTRPFYLKLCALEFEKCANTKVLLNTEKMDVLTLSPLFYVLIKLILIPHIP